MKGDTMLIIDYVKSKVVKGTFRKVASDISNNGLISSFSKVQGGKSSSGGIGVKSVGIGTNGTTIWEWLGNLVGDIWEAINFIGWHLGIPGAWRYEDVWQNHREVRTWDWSWLDGGNQTTTDYIAGDPAAMGFFFGGGGYIITPATDFDRLIIRLGIKDLGAQQALNLRPDIQTAVTNYLNQNGYTDLNLEYAYWVQAYLIANPGEDASVFVPNNLTNYYTEAEMESIFNSIDEPLTGDPVEFFMVLVYQNPKYFDLLRYNVDPNQSNIGSYSIGTYRNKSGTIVCYTAARSGYNGIEFVIKPGQLSLFSAKVSEFTEAADNFYRQGKPSIGWIQTLSGDRWAGFISIWGDAIKSPTWWAYAITSFGHAIARLPTASVGSTTTAPNWRVSMKKMTGDSFQGRAVTNPQGATVTIDIPNNYLPSLSNNGQGINFRPNPAIGIHPDAGLIRIMAPTVDKPNGYAVFYNANGQPFNPLNNQTLGSSNWHFEF